jgi:nucleotide-binding universal stress UspA family protein
MKRFQSVLCPVDFSPFSDVAIRYAAAFAKQSDSKLITLHCIPDFSRVTGFPDIVGPTGVPESVKTAASGRLSELTAKYASVEVTRLISVGHPADIILQTAGSARSDLIVMGTHGRSGFERLLLGSVTYKVLQKSQTPVLVVGKTTRHFIQPGLEHPMKIDRILCAVDLDQGTEEITGMALDLARTFQSKLYVLHVLGKHETTPKTLAMQKLEMVVDAYKEDWCKVEHVVETGSTAERILNTVEEKSANLIVMGHHARGPIADVMMGSNTMKIVTLSSCPVLVMRI